MRRIAFSIAVSGLAFAAVCGTTQATPIAPLPPRAASNATNITPVSYYYHRYWYRHHYGHYHYWHYGFDPTAYNWDYYRVDSPGRGTNEESTR